MRYVLNSFFNLTIRLLFYCSEYNDMKENLIQYLRKFAETKKVVREEDIKEFFDGMGSRKRPKTSVQTFCR